MSAVAWMDAACDLLPLEAAIVRVTVAAVRGSAPRECGATMLVSARELWGTIGGGNLEWQAIEQARRWLHEGRHASARIVEQRLGPDLAQCCGGAVSLWMERIPQASLAGLERLLAPRPDGSRIAAVRTSYHGGQLLRAACEMPQSACRLQVDIAGIGIVERCRDDALPLWLFGAGHVGQAVLRQLAELPLFDVLCLDSRRLLLHTPQARHIAARWIAEPVEAVAQAAPGTAWLVMTHDHELDYRICSAVLRRGDARWLGLIGSASKAARFRSRLRREGFTPAQIGRMCSPVGIPGVPGKLPAAIAVSIVAQLLTLTARQSATDVVDCEADCRHCASATGHAADAAPHARDMPLE